ncbi:MAG TPA: lysylphosphatidylglycerol synthase transmembrane domain-containing protein [Candidatus Limnocylindria bacterium]|nr:lysylphosphatidylglycerol synthase transmembrane domain-containing protein [Candidatus Limnocylindria bacterium]
MSRRWKLLIGIAVSAFCVWLSMRDVDPRAVWIALGQANYLGFVALMITTLAGFWVRAVRWRSLIAAPKPLPLDSLFAATMIGFMANNVLPFRLGEFVRPWALSRRERMSKSTLLATVVVERAVDMLTLLAILGISLLVYRISAETEAGRMIRAGATVLVLLCVGLTAFVVVLEQKPELARGVIGALTARLPEALRLRVSAMLNHFVAGLGLFRDVPRLLWVFLLSFLMFGIVILGLQASLWAFRIDVPWYAGLLMLVITAIGIMVPAAPGYIGTMNIAAIAGLKLFDIGSDVAVPFSWFYWAGQWLPVTVVGLAYLHREGLSLRSLGQAGESAA